MDLPISIPGGADLDNYIDPGMYYCAGGGSATKNAPVSADSYCLFVEKTFAWGTGIKQTFTHYSDGITYQRVCYFDTTGKQKGPWQKLATATPPQEYDLPLAEGITNIVGTESKYWRSQDSTVHVEISVQSASDLPYESLIGTLPVGFIPTKNQPRIAAPGAFVTVLTTGEIKLFTVDSASLPATQWICAEFNYKTYG